MNHRQHHIHNYYAQLQLGIRNCHRGVYDQKWADAGRTENSDPFSRLYYLRAGCAEIRRNELVTHLMPGRLYLIPAHTSYRYMCPSSMDLSYVHFSAMIAGIGPLHHFVRWPLDVKPRNLHWVEERIDLLVDEGSRISPLTRDGALRQLLGLFDETAGSSNSLTAETSRFAPVLRHVESHLDTHIQLSDLAKLLHLQPNYFSDLFRRNFGEAPTRYIQRRKIERAAELLAISDISVKELADQLGFTDAFHLSRTFKTFMGVAPSHYRASLTMER